MKTPIRGDFCLTFHLQILEFFCININFCPISIIIFSVLRTHLWMISVMKVKISSKSFSQPEKLPNISPTPAIVVTVTASGLL